MLALVTTDAVPFLVDAAAADDVVVDDEAALPFESESESESELELSLPTSLLNPVSWTDQELGPPPVTQSAGSQLACLDCDLHVSKLYPLHLELHSESETLLLDTGSRSPHQQLDPLVVPITGLFWLTHCCWQYPGD